MDLVVSSHFTFYLKRFGSYEIVCLPSKKTFVDDMVEEKYSENQPFFSNFFRCDKIYNIMLRFI